MAGRNLGSRLDLRCTNVLVHLQPAVNQIGAVVEVRVNRKIQAICAGAMALLGMVASAPQAAAQAKTEISLSRQPGIFYMPTHIIEKQKLIEKHAAAARPAQHHHQMDHLLAAAARRPTRCWPAASIS